MYSLILTRKVTASRPSSSRWSYVSARYIICIVGQQVFRPLGNLTYRPDLDLAVDGDGLVLDGV
jgi:hypothetical protein